MWKRLNITFSILWVIGILVGFAGTVAGPPVTRLPHVERTQEQRREHEQAQPEHAERRENSGSEPAGAIEFDSLRDNIDRLAPDQQGRGGR